MTFPFPCLKLALLWFAALMCLPGAVLAGPVLGVELKSFAMLGGSTVTSSGKSTLIGSVGVSPGVAVTGFGPAEGSYTGSMHLNDPTADAAHVQLATAITNLQKMGAGTSLDGNLNGLTLAPGVYTVAARASNLTQTLTLDGGGNPNAYWVFKMPLTLITGGGSNVKVINAGAGAGVYWIVGSSATIAGTTFVGNILAATSISMNNAVNLNCGRALAFNGAVTMINDTVNSVDCTGSGVEGSAGLSGGLDVPADGGAPTPLPPPASDNCALMLSVPNHTAETRQASLVNGYGYLGTSTAPNNMAVTGRSGNIGRFVPDHFDTVIIAGVPMPCPRARTCPAAGFVYATQPFGVMVTARSLAGITTENYTGGFARSATLAAWSAPGSTASSNPPASPGGNQLRNPGVAASAFLQGMASVTAPAYAFAAAFPATVNLAPPTDIYLRATDTDGVTSLRTAAVEGGVSVVSGRLQVVNNYGSEVLPLLVNVYAQFWDGARFIYSSTDSMSTF